MPPSLFVVDWSARGFRRWHLGCLWRARCPDGPKVRQPPGAMLFRIEQHCLSAREGAVPAATSLAER